MSASKTLMVIGAGNAQVPLIEAARREGYHTVVCDIDRSAPGAILADEFHAISTKDRRGLMDVARNACVDGVVANSEYAMCDVAHIASSLNLVGNRETAIETLSSKSRFRTLQRRVGLFAPDFVCGHSVAELASQARELMFPVIVKPDQSSGTRGTTVIKTRQDCAGLEDAVARCTSISRNGMAIVEEYVSMPSRATIEGEVFVNEGKTLWDGVFTTIRGEDTPEIPMTYVFPLQEDEHRITAMETAIEQALRSAGVTHGEYNVEAYFTGNDEPFIIEINPRQGGNDLPAYASRHCGIDYYRLLVTSSVGDNGYWDSLKDASRTKRNLVHHMLYPEADGKLQGVWLAKSLEFQAHRFVLTTSIGSNVTRAVDGSSSIGYVDLELPPGKNLLEAAYRVGQSTSIKIEQAS